MGFTGSPPPSQVFLLALVDRLRSSREPLAMMQAAVEMTGQHLRVGRIGYCEVDVAGGTMFYPAGWSDGERAALTGRLPLDSLGERVIAYCQTGQTLIIEDAESDPRAHADKWRVFRFRAALVVPLIREGVWVAGLFVSQTRTRAWTPGEVALLEDVLNRTWEAVERARAEEALRRAERRHAFLFDLLWQQRQAADATTVLRTTSEMAGRYFGVDRAGFLELPDDETLVFIAGWTAGRQPPKEGPLPVSAIGQEGLALVRSGQPYVFSDARTDPMASVSVFEKMGTLASIGAPIIRDGHWRMGFYINHSEPRVWTPDEVNLVRLVADVTWDAVERVRKAELQQANAALQERIATALKEQARTEEALRQSQKMEAVGQLTGGLAHDFNNLLAGITGSLELLRIRLAQGRTQDLERYLNAADGAAKRAAALTHRLLAFSRRQTLAPKPTDANRVMVGMEELVRRTVGPSIRLETVAAGGLWTTLVDASQLENALLNLCINARDAMPHGGKLTLETGNRWLDERAARERELPPGQYVSLCVSDTGTGMTPEIIARAFDPFFTTKPLGLGTGLGLSMVYGFARQSGGQARIDSEVGQGTRVCLYLPRHLGQEETAEEPASLSGAPRAGHDETVLVVDDEPTVRMLVTEVLEDLGYRALEAVDGASGLKLLQSPARIDLLVTDVGLPGGMNGRQMADAARVGRPALKVLFITGYAENAVVGHGHLDQGMHVMTKPFAMEALASRIKELLVGG